MKYHYHILIFILGCISFYACEKVTEPIAEPMAIDNENDCLSEDSGYKSEEVAFKTTYPYITRVIPSIFETIEIPITIKDAGTTNSIYKSTSSIVKTKDAYTRNIRSTNAESIEIVTDYCNIFTISFSCRDSSFTESIESTNVPAKYDTFIYEKLDKYIEGGDTIYKEEIKIDYPKLLYDSTTEYYENYSPEFCIDFIIPRSKDVIDIIDSIYLTNGIQNCLNSIEYRIK